MHSNSATGIKICEHKKPPTMQIASEYHVAS